MNKTLKILIIPFIIILGITIYTIYLTNNNTNYMEKTLKNIKDNYQINEEITYYNEYNNYYIFTTKTKVIVLNNEYEEILNEDITNIMKRKNNQELIYKTNKLMFEETILDDNNLTYKYYDASNYELVKETVLEMQ